MNVPPPNNTRSEDDFNRSDLDHAVKTRIKVSGGTKARHKSHAQIVQATANRKQNRIEDTKNGISRLEMRVFASAVPAIKRWIKTHGYAPASTAIPSDQKTIPNSERPDVPNPEPTELEKTDRSNPKADTTANALTPAIEPSSPFAMPCPLPSAKSTVEANSTANTTTRPRPQTKSANANADQFEIKFGNALT